MLKHIFIVSNILKISGTSQSVSKNSPKKYPSKSNISSRLESVGFLKESGASSNQNFLISAMNKLDRKKSNSTSMISAMRRK